MLSVLRKYNSDLRIMHLNIRELWALERKLAFIDPVLLKNRANKTCMMTPKLFLSHNLYLQVKHTEYGTELLLFRCWFNGKVRKCYSSIMGINKHSYPDFRKLIKSMASYSKVAEFEDCHHNNCEAYMACTECHPLPRISN